MSPAAGRRARARTAADVGDGRRLSFDLSAGETSVTVPDVADGETVTLEVAARMPTGSFGPSAIARLGGTGAPPAVTIAPPARATSGGSVDLTATAVAGTDPIASIAWELDGDGMYDDAGGASVSQRFDRPGEHPVGVRVTDTAGRMAVATQTVTVDSRAPEASIDFDGSPSLAGETVSLTATDSDPDGIVRSRAWDLDGDGRFTDGTGLAVEHQFPAGTVTVRARVADSGGAVTTVERTASVSSPPAPPTTPAAPAPTPAPASPPATSGSPHPPLLGGLTLPKSARRATLLKSGLTVTLRNVQAGARLEVVAVARSGVEPQGHLTRRIVYRP